MSQRVSSHPLRRSSKKLGSHRARRSSYRSSRRRATSNNLRPRSLSYRTAKSLNQINSLRVVRDKRNTCRSRDSVILRCNSEVRAPISRLHLRIPRKSKHNSITFCTSTLKYTTPTSFRQTFLHHTNTKDIGQRANMKPTTYEANCHCGSIRYKVTLEDALAPEGTKKVNRCNCSICTKYGK